MYEKLPVCKFLLKNACPKLVRHKSKSALTQLEKFERLRSLCCTSEMERRRMEAEAALGPKTLPAEGSVPVKGPCAPCEEHKPMELTDVRCKTAMVIGGASGIGFETCNALVKAGAGKVCIVDYRQDKAIAAADKLNCGTGEPKACPVMADIRSDCAYDMAFREVIRCFSQVDIFVNCVGIFDETPECWDQMVNLNLVGAIRGTILAYHYMSQNTREDWPQGGVILNVSSYGAIANVPTMPLFSAVSAGINGLMSSFGQDFHYNSTGVRCLALCPGCTTKGILKKMDRYHYRREWASHSVTAMKCNQKQTAKDVARAVVHTLRFGLNGNIYVIAGGKYYRYLMPDYRKIVRQEAYLL